MMTDTNMEEWIEELLNNCRILEEQIQEAQQDAGTNTEKELLVRQLTSKDNNKNTHARNLDMCQLYFTSVEETEKELNRLLKKDLSILTQSATEEIKLMIQTKINSIKQFAN